MNLSELPVITGGAYIHKELGVPLSAAYSDKHIKEREALEEIITLEAGYYMSRRIPGGWGHLVENFEDLRRRAINAYEEQFDTEYNYYNEEFL